MTIKKYFEMIFIQVINENIPTVESFSSYRYPGLEKKEAIKKYREFKKETKKRYEKFKKDVTTPSVDILVKKIDLSKIKVTKELLKYYQKEIIEKLKEQNKYLKSKGYMKSGQEYSENFNELDIEDFSLRYYKYKANSTDLINISLVYFPPEFKKARQTGDFIPKRGYSISINVNEFFKNKIKKISY